MLTDNFLDLTGQDQHMPEIKNQQSVRHTGCYFVSPVLNSRVRVHVACVCVWVCVCVCVDREEIWVFAGTALVIVWTAVSLTSSPYSDYLTSFHEPLSPPYRCYTVWKMSNVITGQHLESLKNIMKVWKMSGLITGQHHEGLKNV